MSGVSYTSQLFIMFFGSFRLFMRGSHVNILSVPLDPMYSIPLYRFALIIGGIIAVTLAYVAWRKYQAEKKYNDKKKDQR